MAAWRIEFDGQVYRENDLTIGQAEKVEELTNTSWRFLNPLRSAGHCSAILAVCISDRLGVSLDDARTKIRDVKVNEFLDLIKEDEDDDLPSTFEDGFPQPADGTSTTT